MTELTISKAAKNAGVGVENIRFYERKGLIEQPPKPLDIGFRFYPEETVQRVSRTAWYAADRMACGARARVSPAL